MRVWVAAALSRRRRRAGNRERDRRQCTHGLAFAIAVLAAREMARARTAIHPGKAAATLVRTGVFARSRNPIYLSFVFFMVGFGLATANPWMMLLAPLLLLYVQERIIKREEAYLTGASDRTISNTGKRCGVGFRLRPLGDAAVSGETLPCPAPYRQCKNGCQTRARVFDG